MFQELIRINNIKLIKLQIRLLCISQIKIFKKFENLDNVDERISILSNISYNIFRIEELIIGFENLFAPVDEWDRYLFKEMWVRSEKLKFTWKKLKLTSSTLYLKNLIQEMTTWTKDIIYLCDNFFIEFNY